MSVTESLRYEAADWYCYYLSCSLIPFARILGRVVCQFQFPDSTALRNETRGSGLHDILEDINTYLALRHPSIRFDISRLVMTIAR